MAVYEKTVDPNGGADYSSLSAWVAGEQSLYSSGDIARAVCQRSGATKDTTAVNVAGFTTGVIPEITVDSNYTHEGKWADTRASDGNYIYILESSATLRVNNAKLQHLILEELYVYNAPVSLVVNSNIIRTLTSGNNGLTIFGAGSFRNNVVFRGANSGTGKGIRKYGGDAAYLDNNTVYDFSIGMSSEAAGAIARNNYAGGNTTDFDDASFSWDSATNYNVSSDATAPGTNAATGKTSYATYFVAHTSGDFHLTDTSSTLWGLSGTDLSGTFTDDIDGETRSNWDVGADEYVVTGFEIVGSGSVSFTASATFTHNIHPSLTGSGALSFAANATMEQGQHITYTGAGQVSISSAAGMLYNLNASLTGDGNITSSSAATLLMNQNPSILGDGSLVLTSNATMAYNLNAALLGDGQLTITSGAALDYTQHPSIVGSGQVDFTSAAIMDHTQNPSIIGTGQADIIANATLAINRNYSLSGAGSFSIIANAGMTATQGNSIIGDSVVEFLSGATLVRNQNPSITGSGEVSFVSSAVLEQNNNYSIIGSSQVDLTSLADLQHNNAYVLSGQGSVTLTPSATSLYNRNVVIQGDIAIAITGSAATQYNINPSIAGDGIVTITGAASLVYTSVASTEIIKRLMLDGMIVDRITLDGSTVNKVSLDGTITDRLSL